MLVFNHCIYMTSIAISLCINNSYFIKVEGQFTNLTYHLYYKYEGNGKAIPLQALKGPSGCWRSRLPGFLGKRHINLARLLSLSTGRLYPPGKSLVLVYVRH